MIRAIAVIAFSLLATGCVSKGPSRQEVHQHFLEIADNPSEFDGRTIRVTGWISLRHEDKNLWATPSDHEDWNIKHCISLIGYDKLNADALDGKYVEVNGVLRKDASESGNLIRLASCRDVAIEIENASSVSVVED